MKRKLAGLLALVMVSALLLTGCGTPKGNALPDGLAEETVLEAGRQVAALLNGGDYQAVYDQLRPDGQRTTSPENIQAYMEDLTQKLGTYEKELQAMATGQTLKDTGEEYATAVLICKHSKKDVMYRIAFSTDMELMGFEATKSDPDSKRVIQYS